MKERPILFSGPMARAILAGQKTQTRRTVKVRGVGFIGGRGQENDPAAWGYAFEGPAFHGWGVLARDMHERYDHGRNSIPCPHGAPGDRLWVRETFAPAYYDGGRTAYRADQLGVSTTWKPSIFMPRALSRLTLEIVAVRVERLRDISDADIAAEGVTRAAVQALLSPKKATFLAELTPREYLRVGWTAINGAESWDADPWVWAIEFRKATT